MTHLRMVQAIQILLLALAADAYVPPAVEVPPMDVNQIRASQTRREAPRNQVSYSYGTTSYHQQQVPGRGYAAAHLANEQAGQSRPFVPDQRSECQNAMLRTFFKHCHPPGTAPQSPVQCEPIPGQTTFRCLIKQQSWPVVRISQCPPGTAASNGDCVQVPGSFSTNGVMIVPVSSPQRVVQTSSVYRHCANGACQTCIGDQCSTTGVRTPVSVDHRGRANSTTEVVAFGDAGRDVKQKCAGRFCKTCIDKVCYDRSYPLLRVTAGCPPAACETDCDDFVYWTDQCPICRCRGFASREPCRTQSECPAGAACRNQLCIYAELPNMHFDKVCTFSSQCPSDQMCYNWRCGSKAPQSRHLNQSCATDSDCPSGYTCADMTCWEGEASRLRGQDCTLDHQCPAGYFCTNGKCTDVYHHGSFDSFDEDEDATTIAPTTDRQCEHDQQCYSHERCWERRCVTVDEYRWMDEARRRQQSEHQGWAQRQTTTSAPQGHAAEDEYQRRLAEYNRQVAEQQRQYEERRRQAEEERRRHEEAEAQRRRQEQEEAERRRLQQDNERRRQEQEDARRRQELEQRRRQQEEENQRRIREEEAARRAPVAQGQPRGQQNREQETQRRQEQEQARRRQEQEAEQTRRRQEEQEARRRQQEEDARRRQEEEAVRRRQQEEEASRRQGQEDATRRQQEDARKRQQEQDARRQQQEADTRRRQQEEEVRRREQEEEARRRQEEEDTRRRQEQKAEESRRRQEEEEQEARRRQQQEHTTETGQEAQTDSTGHGHEEEQTHIYEPDGPDVEIGEEMPEEGASDDDAEYERRMQEYNRQLRERQRQLQAEVEVEEEPGPVAEGAHQAPEDPMQHPEVEVHDDENDFYGRTRENPPVGQTRDQSVSSYRVRYQRVRRRQ